MTFDFGQNTLRIGKYYFNGQESFKLINGKAKTYKLKRTAKYKRQLHRKKSSSAILFNTLLCIYFSFEYLYEKIVTSKLGNLLG